MQACKFRHEDAGRSMLWKLSGHLDYAGSEGLFPQRRVDLRANAVTLVYVVSSSNGSDDFSDTCESFVERISSICLTLAMKVSGKFNMRNFNNKANEVSCPAVCRAATLHCCNTFVVLSLPVPVPRDTYH
ncbi:unnamed protein product [Colias eurytheme]|nr:unnamed protein product [Colias eurytheme]